MTDLQKWHSDSNEAASLEEEGHTLITMSLEEGP